MQCFLIFDHLNDVIYVKQDEKFYLYIRKRCVKEGLLQEEDGFFRPGTLEYHNALVQLFSPMVASQRIMINQFNSPYSAITCQDGTRLNFIEYLSYILVEIGRGNNVSEAYLRRKLRISLRLATFLCGPTLDILRSSSGELIEKRELLGRLIDCWEVLYRKDLSFRVEAQERLLTNSDLCGNWVKLLQNVLEKVRQGISEASTCHAFILIKTKVLALYSSRNASSISDGDLLLLILLSASHHNEILPMEEHGPDGQLESVASSDSEQYFSPCASPAIPGNSTGALSYISGELSREVLNITIEEGSEELSGEHSNVDVDLADGYVDISSDFKSNLVFLRSSFGTMVPYVVNYVYITEGIVLVTVSAVNKHVLSSSLVAGIETLHLLQNTISSSSPKATMDSLDTNIRSITESLKKIKTDEDIEGYVKRLQNGWDVAKKSGFIDFLKQKDLNAIPAKLERSLNGLSSCMKTCFQKYCVGWYHRDMSVSGALIDAQALVRYTLADYVEYLKVKCDQNISMANYYADFAGMVHFIFVDRTSNQIIVPSMDVQDRGPEGPSSHNQISIYKKLCYMVDKAWTHLSQGHTTVIWRDDCYHYSYFLWFEDAVGNPCKPHNPHIALQGATQPGIISGNYYKQLIRTCFPSTQEFIRCYELYCLHLATVPPIVVNHQACKLNHRIWELSGAAQSPVDLLL